MGEAEFMLRHTEGSRRASPNKAGLEGQSQGKFVHSKGGPQKDGTAPGSRLGCERFSGAGQYLLIALCSRGWLSPGTVPFQA